MGCAILEDHLYVVGGTNRDNKVLTSVEQYSFRENTWQLVAPMHEARASTAVAAVNGRLYVFGGDVINEEQFYRARTTIADVECYDPNANTWSKCQSLPESRSEAGAAVV
jgi:actin-binding protein IPP